MYSMFADVISMDKQKTENYMDYNEYVEAMHNYLIWIQPTYCFKKWWVVLNKTFGGLIQSPNTTNWRQILKSTGFYKVSW